MNFNLGSLHVTLSDNCLFFVLLFTFFWGLYAGNGCYNIELWIGEDCVVAYFKLYLRIYRKILSWLYTLLKVTGCDGTARSTAPLLVFIITQHNVWLYTMLHFSRKEKVLWREDMSSYKGSETLESPKITAFSRPTSRTWTVNCSVWFFDSTVSATKRHRKRIQNVRIIEQLQVRLIAV
jgi:hypothetical protein